MGQRAARFFIATLLLMAMPLAVLPVAAQSAPGGNARLCDAEPMPPMPFVDVPSDGTFCTEIAELAATGITLGRADGTFRPDEVVTRGAMAAFFYRMADAPSGPFAPGGFTDVTSEATFATEIDWLASTRITVGRADGTFGPGEPVTRAAMAGFLYRLAGSPAGPFAPAGFSDVATDATFAAEIDWLAATGITVGRADGTFAPGEPVGRGAMAAFLVRFLSAAEVSVPDVALPSPPTRPVATVPGVPRGLTVTPGDGQLVVTWDPPGADGPGVCTDACGAPVTDYAVSLDPPDAGPFTVAVDASRSTVAQGLTNGTTYAVSVVATNRIGASTPVTTEGIPNTAGLTFTAISAGDAHTCGIADGAAYCWGTGTAGVLGTGSTVGETRPVAVATAPVGTSDGTPVSALPSGATVTAITAGDYHTCAIADGTAYCWGFGSNGRLGDGFEADRALPVAVATGVGSALPDGVPVTAIDAGNAHTCAIAAGIAYCWGFGFAGRIGDGTTDDRPRPVAVATSADAVPVGEAASALPAGVPVTAITAGDLLTCAVAAGRAYCWGSGTGGQLGDGGLVGQPRPVAVATGDGSALPVDATVTAIDAANGHTCAVADGAAYCWGSARDGRLGSGDTVTQVRPVAVATSADAVPDGETLSALPADATVTDITTGLFHTCAIADGAAYCWGLGNNGRLGAGDTLGRARPVAVTPSADAVPDGESASALPGGATATDIAAGRSHSCVVAGARAYCWGPGGLGQLGNDVLDQSIRPASVLEPA